jgi:hypothetical protein
MLQRTDPLNCWRTLTPSLPSPAARLYQEFAERVFTCLSYDTKTECDAGDSCTWSGTSCKSSADDNPIKAVFATTCTASNSSAICRAQNGLTDVSRTCGMKSKSTCVTDDCEWSPTDNECSISNIGVGNALQKAGSKVMSVVSLQTAACSKLATKEACLAEPAPSGFAGSGGGSQGSGGSTATTTSAGSAFGSTYFKGADCDFNATRGLCGASMAFLDKGVASPTTEVDR